MPTTYEKCGEEVEAVIRKVAKKYHVDLVKAKVTIGSLFARNDDGEAVKLHGYPCAATVKKNSLKDRAEGKTDATITIDEKRWNELSEDEKDALIDHELYHLNVKRNERGDFDYDDLGRPKLTMVLHDAQIGIFKSIIERHGAAALDAQIAEKFIDEYGQLLMWAKDKTTVG
jgi:hypothetical protein